MYTLDDVISETRAGRSAFYEFLRRDAMSAAMYILPGGGNDDQKPHREDEIYLVLKGNGMIRVGNEEAAVGPGSLIFVPALEEHRFHDFTEDLEILVIFAPAYTGRT